MTRSMRVTSTILVGTTLALLLAVFGAASAGAQDARVLGLEKSTSVREHAGWLLYSRWDGSAYRLAVWRDGVQRDLAVPAQSGRFDADVGPDSAGRPSAIVSICRSSCDLFVIGFEAGDALRPVRNANTSDHDELAPSVWRGRIAFGRRYDRDTVVPYTKRLVAPRQRPSDRLAGLPARRCGAYEPPSCRRIEEVGLSAMELWGRWVAQSWTYQPDAFPGHLQDEIRLTDIERTDTRQLAAMTTGEGGQTYLGPSLVNGRVAFFKACLGDPGGCHSGRSGAISYRISSGDYRLADAQRGWTGWAWDGASAFHVPSSYECAGGDPGYPGQPCGIYRMTPDWRAASADRFRP